MPYGHLITATVMTLGVCQGRSSIASFSILTSASRGPSAIAEPLVCILGTITYYVCMYMYVCMYACKTEIAG